MTEEEVRRFQKKKNGEENVGFRKRTDEGFKEKIVEAETRNRRHLQDYVPKEERTEEKDDDMVKLATEEDVKNIKKMLIRNQAEILSKIENLEDLLRKKTSTRKER